MEHEMAVIKVPCAASSITRLTPSKAIRAYCVHCLVLKQFNADEVKNCTGDALNCPFFPYRLGKRPSVKIFRAFCIDCMGGRADLVRDCSTMSCHAYTFRMGKNPALIGKRKSSQAGLDALKKVNQIRRDDDGGCQVSIFSGQDVGSIIPA